MWAQVESILRQATSRIAEHAAEFLPGVLVAVLLALVTLVVAILVRVALVRILMAGGSLRWLWASPRR